jgi:hypothetical protein
MMGRRDGGQGQFFIRLIWTGVVPPDHLVRQIDGILDLSWVHKELSPYYSHTGRPSIDPVLVGYVFAIRSERRLCSEVQVNLAYRWFCKLSIEDSIPDHSVFCRALGLLSELTIAYKFKFVWSSFLEKYDPPLLASFVGRRRGLDHCFADRSHAGVGRRRLRRSRALDRVDCRLFTRPRLRRRHTPTNAHLQRDHCQYRVVTRPEIRNRFRHHRGTQRPHWCAKLFCPGFFQRG